MQLQQPVPAPFGSACSHAASSLPLHIDTKALDSCISVPAGGETRRRQSPGPSASSSACARSSAGGHALRGEPGSPASEPPPSCTGRASHCSGSMGWRRSMPACRRGRRRAGRAATGWKRRVLDQGLKPPGQGMSMRCARARRARAERRRRAPRRAACPTRACGTCSRSCASTSARRSANSTAESWRLGGGRKPKARKKASAGQSPYEMVTSAPRLG